MKKLSYVKLHETWCLYFPFLFSLSVMQSFFSFPASSLFGTQQQLTHPTVKNSTLPLRKMRIFQGVAPWHTVFTSCCVIPLWDLATAHSPSCKELKLSSLEESCFSELILLLMFWYDPVWAIFGLVLTYMVYFCSERLPLSKIFYSMRGLFL